MRPRAIEAGALKNRHVFETLLGALENAQAGKAEVSQNRRRLQLAKVEIGRLVDDLLRHAVLDDIDRNRRRVDKAPMQGLKRKAEFLIAPDRGARYPSDRRVLIKGEARKHAWQRRFRRLERFRGQFDRHLHDGVGGEWNRLAQRFGGGGGRAGRGQRSRERPADRQLQEFATLPVRHRILRSLAAQRDRPRQPEPASFPANMISQPGGENRAASPTRSVLGQVVVYRFLRRSETQFAQRGQTGSIAAALRLETAVGRGDIVILLQFGPAEPRLGDAP